MKYRINKENYRDFEVIGANRLPARSYFIPYPDKMSADAVSLTEKRYRSGKVRCLNGDWDFLFYPRPSELPDVLDTETAEFRKIKVPGCWQFQGYDRPFYVNTRYQFPFDPPRIPEEEPVGPVFSWIGADTGLRSVRRTPENEYNYVGVYRRFFTVENEALRHELSFLGTASCLDVYVNGEFAGYSEGSHNTAEFDITEMIRPGENELLAVVRRWCTGTYLECQDMFRNNGIFRDVLLRVSRPADVRDFRFERRKIGAVYDAEVPVELYERVPESEVTVSIAGHGIGVSRTLTAKEGRARAVFTGLEVKEWNAEEPVLYDLYIETPGTCIKTRVGFKNITIDGNVLKLNGSRFKIKGVNHHDSSPTGGYTMTPEEIEKDVRLCKEYNINAIRTSHYPPDPLLLELCDEYGIYVIDEADLETHGAYSMKLPPDYNRISRDPKWEAHYLDRAERLYERDKLHPSVIMWSLGNEAGGFRCQDGMARWLKKRTRIPLHYEGAVHSRRRAYDIAGEMYPTHEIVRKTGEGRRRIREMNDRPYFLCEYLHAMGTGPGGGEEYWQEIYAHDNLCGGCVWEMNDHAVLHPDGRYTYGGDHGEWEHDGNFCVDGLFYPDRTPSTGAAVIRHLYRPVRVRYAGKDRFEIFNTTGFSEGKRFRLIFRWSDGYTETVIPSAGPLSKEIIRIGTEEHIGKSAENGTDAFVNILTLDIAEGKALAEEQIFLAPQQIRRMALTHTIPFGPEWSEKGALPVVDLALLAGGSKSGGEKERLLPSNPSVTLFRAPTDNDVLYGLMPGPMKDYAEEREEILQADYRETGCSLVTRIHCGKRTFLVSEKYKRTQEGILVSVTLTPEKKKNTQSRRPGFDLPRFGRTFTLDSSFRNVTYYGRCGETYCDMKEQYPIGEVSCSVEDMTEPNIRPQESGNRCDCRFVSLDNGRIRVTFTALDEPFELGIKPYTDRELMEMTHREEEKTTGTYVTLSAFNKGIGTGSCGPGTLPKYCYPANRKYRLRFMISAELL